MKILYHHRTLSKDGQNVHIEELVAAFRRAGHCVHVVGPETHRKAAFGSDGGFLSRLRHRLPPAVGELAELGYSFFAFWRLHTAYRAVKPDVLYERYNLFLLSGAWLGKLTGLPLVLEVNAPLALERRVNSGLALRRLADWCERTVWRAADHVLPVTKVLAGHVLAAGVHPGRILVLPNGIERGQFAQGITGDRVRRQYGLEGKTVIGFTGFLRDWHGLPAIIDVIQRSTHTALHFLVVGDGPGRAALEHAARTAGVADRITITGVVDRRAIAEHICAFDIAVQPKATDYASPLKLFEYMALGRAIVAPDQPNLREVLVHERNALLFAPDDPASLSDVLARLIADPRLRNSLGSAAAASIDALDLTWDGNAHKIVAAIEATVGRQPRQAPLPSPMLERRRRPASPL